MPRNEDNTPLVKTPDWELMPADLEDRKLLIGDLLWAAAITIGCIGFFWLFTSL